MERLIGFKEVAEITGIRESTIRKMATKQSIPFVRIGKHIRFDPGDIAAWISAKKAGPEPEETKQ